MIWFLFQEIGFYIFLVLTLYFTVKKDYTNLLSLYFWSGTFASCYMFYVTIWSPEKIVSLAMFWCVITHKIKRGYVASLLFISMLLLFMLLYSNVVAFSSTPRYNVEIGRYQRIALQDFSFITAIFVLFYGLLLDNNFINKIYPKYCRAIECAIAIGFIHFLCLQFGVEFMPILRTGGAFNEGETVLAEFGNQTLQRLYGFSGEPKGLAFCIVPYLIISIVNLFRGNVIRNTFYHILFIILGVFVLIGTMSSSAIINFILMLPLTLLLVSAKPKSFFFKNKNLKYAMPVLIIGIFVFLTFSTSGKQFSNSMYERTFLRGMTEMENGRQEAIIYDAFKSEDGFTQLFGWGLGQYTFNVPGQTTGDGNLIPVQSGLILTMTDFGYLGLFIYFLFIIMPTIDLSIKTMREGNPLLLAFSLAAVSKIVESFVHGSVITSVFYLMIAFTAYYSNQKNRHRLSLT